MERTSLPAWKQNLHTDNTNNSTKLTSNAPNTAWIWGIAALLGCISLSWNQLSSSHPQQHNDSDGLRAGGSQPQPWHQHPWGKRHPPQGAPQSCRTPGSSAFKQAMPFLTARMCPSFSAPNPRSLGKSSTAQHEPLETPLTPREDSSDPSLQHP